jgi:hypothetical protein
MSRVDEARNELTESMEIHALLMRRLAGRFSELDERDADPSLEELQAVQRDLWATWRNFMAMAECLFTVVRFGLEEGSAEQAEEDTDASKT